MSTLGPRPAIKLGFAAVLIVGLLAFGRIALPFAVSTGPLALNYVENSLREILVARGSTLPMELEA
jgi:hypothetical protein